MNSSRKNFFCYHFFMVTIACFIVLLMRCKDNAVSTPEQLYNLSTDKDSLTFNYTGGNLSFILNTNAAWQVNTSSTEVSFTPDRGDQAAVNQVISVSMNPLTDYRNIRTTISVKTGDIATDEVIRKFIQIIQIGPVKPDRQPGIWSKSDYIAFAAAYNKGGDISEWKDDKGVINLWDNIDFGTDKIPLIGGQSTDNALLTDVNLAFTDHFNGHNKTIKGQLDDGNVMLVALFTRLAPAGIIENLVADITATSTWTAANGHLAGIVGFSLAITAGDTVVHVNNCIVKGKLTQSGTGTGTRVGGIVAYCRTSISGCENQAAIDAASNRVGGIIGGGGGAYTISNCKNSGAISANCSGAQVGGIIGQLNGQTVVSCVNQGNITAVANAATQVGGIAGQGQGTSSIGSDKPGDKCINTGTITLTLPAGITPSAAAAGGIAGNLNAAGVPVKNCENTGNIISTADHASVSVGGIGGKFTAATPITSCVNSGAVSAATQAGGIVGWGSSAGTITSCTNTGAIGTLATATIPEKGTFIGGIIGKKGAATYTNCTYGGTVSGVAGSADNAEGK